MGFIELKAYAKINLSLDVLCKRPDGYHDLKMVMQTIELHDKVFLEAIPKGIEVLCNSKWVPCGEENIAHKAASLLFNEYKFKSGIRIKIEKNIPVAAGLAGGSSDAASVLKGMNDLFNLGINKATMTALGKQVGADVPYCIKGGTALAEGIGDILTELPLLDGINVILIKPRFGVSTPWVFKNLDLSKITDRPDNELIINAIKEKNIENIACNMKNVLETVTIPKYGMLEEIKTKLIKLGALGSMMSGSGPSVFGIFADKSSAESAFRAIKSNKWDSFLTHTV